MDIVVLLIDLILPIDMMGATLWTMGISMADSLFGTIPVVKDNLMQVTWALILVFGVFVMVAAGKSRRSRHGV